MALYAKIGAWLSLGLIIFVTLSPIGLRPVVTGDPSYERIMAFAVLGAMFGLAYPRRFRFALGIVVGAAVVLEGLQHLTPDRHGQLQDLIEKVSGSLFGLVLANAAAKYLPWS